MRKQPTAIAILGMHRSGTSLFSKVIRSLGVYMGREEDMISPREDNPEGFWELSAIVDFHDRLLKSMSSSWDTTKPLPDQWWMLEGIVPYKEELKRIVEAHFSNRLLWAWKDPRTCLTLPLWKAVLAEMGIQTRYILCVRNPLNVAASLSKRDRFSIEKSFALWTLHTLSGFYYTRDEARMVLRYDQLLESPVEIGQQLSGFIGVSYGEIEQQAVRLSPTPGLRHGNSTKTDLLRESKAPTIVKELYSRLEEEASGNRIDDSTFNDYIDEKYRFLTEALQVIDHPRSYRMQLYWADDAEEFSENKSTYVTITAGRDVVRYAMPFKGSRITKLRIDPIDDIGYVKITNLSASSRGSRLKLLGAHRAELVNFINDHEASESIIGIATNNDPQIVFRDIPPLYSDTTLEVEMSVSFRLDTEIIKVLNEYSSAEIVKSLRSMDARLGAWEQTQQEVAVKQREIESLRALLAERDQAMNELAEQFEKQLETLEMLHNETIKWVTVRKDIDRELELTQYEVDQLRQQLTEHDVTTGQSQELREKLQLIRLKEQEIERYQSEIRLYAGSLSWRVTKPLRFVSRAVRKAKRLLKRMAKSSLQGYVIRLKNRKERFLVGNKFKWREYVLIVSHTNYLQSMGGTEKYIYEQAAHLARKGIGIVQLFPGKDYGFLDNKPDAYYGVVIDGQFSGYYPIGQICGWLVNHSSRLQTMYTHHLLFWQYQDYMHVLRMVKGQGLKSIFFMHDFFALCSSYHMMFEPDTEDSIKQQLERRTCIPKLAKSEKSIADICLSCKHYPQLSAWREAIQSILADTEHIIAPSDFVKNTAVSVYGGFAEKIRVQAHLTFSKQHIVHKSKPKRKIRLAYLGYKMDNKGWALWERLYNDESLRRHYEFHHVGSQENYSDHVQKHRYSFITHGTMAAVDLLVNQDIDLVLLWSVVPESYSYTFHEAAAAGVPVLTSPKSGNIAYSINVHPELGKVLRNEETLLEFLHRIEDVRVYVAGDRARYDLEYNALPFD